ncbi:MAG TPA: porin family protein [Draconibacterium sp.]|nr:porin family protein [Draconibacterium sp.]
MKKIIFTTTFLLFSAVIFAQPIFDLGIKAGINNSKITANLSEFNSESIVKAHIGAFARLGYGRIYLQPEAYFSSKGGKLSSGLLDNATKFDFNNIDVPILFGVKVVKGGAANVRAMAGPVFSFLISGDVSGDNRFTVQYFKDNYFGYQYGIGVDLWNFFIDARIEHGTNNLYVYPNDPYLRSKNRTFMVTVGFKIL